MMNVKTEMHNGLAGSVVLLGISPDMGYLGPMRGLDVIIKATGSDICGPFKVHLL